MQCHSARMAFLQVLVDCKPHTAPQLSASQWHTEPRIAQSLQQTHSHRRSPVAGLLEIERIKKAVSCLTLGGRLVGLATNYCTHITHITVASPGCSLSSLTLLNGHPLIGPVTPATATLRRQQPTNQPTSPAEPQGRQAGKSSATCRLISYRISAASSQPASESGTPSPRQSRSHSHRHHGRRRRSGRNMVSSLQR